MPAKKSKGIEVSRVDKTIVVKMTTDPTDATALLVVAAHAIARKIGISAQSVLRVALKISEEVSLEEKSYEEK